ncbi:MAG: DPP IV N-terminal domain-containing protein [Gemmataceae bacterium]|nr:DPP IV N-terminal domain-containing protein [Gemmataceae bacterium]
MRSFAATLVAVVFAFPALAGDPIRLANNPSLSPDGSTLAFDWSGDIWVASSTGGTARALTQNPARDSQPKFSPDGKEIAFISDRDGTPQVYVTSVNGGTPTRLTWHTAGFGLEGWTPDGTQLLVRATRDHHWRHGERFFLIPRDGRAAEKALFDDYGLQGNLSPDGRKLLFVREGTQWWRKGYHGSQAAQVWMYDLDSGKFTQVCSPDRGANWPMWKPDGKSCYVVSAKNGAFNIHECDPATGKDRQLTNFPDDSVVQPTLSRDGSTMVFRHLFDFYRLKPGSGGAPEKITLEASGDRTTEPVERRTLSTAQQVAFASDGLEIAFIAGGDLWVMDTELREPKRITTSAEEERDPVMSPDGKYLYFISDMHGECNIWRAERADAAKWWWQQTDFKLSRLTQDPAHKGQLKLSPDGKQLAFVRDRGDLVVMNVDGKNERKIRGGFTPPEYNWSPDSAWMVYAVEDNDFNRDVWVHALDGSVPPYNLSRTPHDEHFPVWSPDGKVIAWTGRRGEQDNDIHFVFLRAEDDQTTARDRTLEKALDKMKTRRAPGTPEDSDAADQQQPPAQQQPGVTISPSSGTAPALPTPIKIDFTGIHDRIRVVPIADSTETDLFWSPNGKRLAFTATVEGRRGTYAIDIPDDPRPKSLVAATGSQARWLRNNQVVWLANGVPASFSASGGAAAPAARPGPTLPAGGGGGRRGNFPNLPAAPAAPSATDAPAATTEYRFAALQQYDRAAKHGAVFDLAWRTMRDQYYDPKLGNRDWNAVRLKYLDMARACPDLDSTAVVVNLMLGELNGSHLGFFPGSSFATRNQPPAEPAAGAKWTESTAHLGVRFDSKFAGPGLRIRDVLPGGPGELARSKMNAGDVIVAIDGQEVGPNTDLTTVLNAAPGKEFSVRLKTGDAERTITVRPTSYAQARAALYRKWIDDNRKAVDKLSNGKLGYVHIDAMAMPSFYKFQTELFSVGHGKDGLIIDVRENGGGSTADHLLTALCQPEHAITVPRGGGPGYPQDRRVYATWSKPIVVMCNQNSFSNAEIFAHAIKNLKRGRVVGVPTAGGVISTGAAQIMDAGTLRLPFRGWYSSVDGKDMELNGAVPDVVVWPAPGDLPAGKDVQLEKAVATLGEDVTAWKARPRPKLVNASELEPAGREARPVVKDAPQ